MSMKVNNRQVDGVTVVDMSGRITLGEGSVVLRDSIRDLIGKGQKKILLNLGDVAGKGVAAAMLMSNLHAMFSRTNPNWTTAGTAGGTSESAVL